MIVAIEHQVTIDSDEPGGALGRDLLDADPHGLGPAALVVPVVAVAPQQDHRLAEPRGRETRH